MKLSLVVLTSSNKGGSSAFRSSFSVSHVLTITKAVQKLSLVF